MAKRRTETGSSPDSGSRPSLMWKWLRLLLLSAFMFTVGVFVGRGTAPVRFDIPGIQQRLKALRAEAFREDVARYRIESTTPGDRRAMKFREVLREPVDPSAAAPAAGTTGAVRRPAVPAARSAADKKSQVQDRGHPYVLQVASMKDGEAASVMVEKFKRQGYPAYRESIEIPDKGVWYRVRVGAFPDRQTAETVQSQMGAVAQESLLIRK